MSSGARLRPKVRWRDRIAVLAFVPLWLVPVGYGAVVSRPPDWFGAQAQDLYNICCLFTRCPSKRTIFYLQVKREGSDRWEFIDESEFFQLEPFGHRNRFDRYMSKFAGEADRESQRAELAAWLAHADSERFPERRPIVRVRYMAYDVHMDPDHPPDGRWIKPDPATIRPIMFHPYPDEHTP